MRAYVYAALAATALALLAWATYSVFEAGKTAGSNACEAKHADASNKATAEVSRREQASADVSNTMLDYLAAQMPKAEARTNETVERIRVVYRDRPVPTVCEFPTGVREALGEAIDRANAAAR